MLRVETSVRGDHVHALFRAGEVPGSLALCGTLSLRREEWLLLRRVLLGHGHLGDSRPHEGGERIDLWQ